MLVNRLSKYVGATYSVLPTREFGCGIRVIPIKGKPFLLHTHISRSSRLVTLPNERMAKALIKVLSDLSAFADWVEVPGLTGIMLHIPTQNMVKSDSDVQLPYAQRIRTRLRIIGPEYNSTVYCNTNTVIAVAIEGGMMAVDILSTAFGSNRFAVEVLVEEFGIPFNGMLERIGIHLKPRWKRIAKSSQTYGFDAEVYNLLQTKMVINQYEKNQ